MNIRTSLPFLTAFLVTQAGLLSAGVLPDANPDVSPQALTTSVPLYRVTVIQGSAKAINYRNLKHSTDVDLLGTVLAANASGEARVESEDGGIQIKAKVKNLPPPSTFGGEYLTYVLWAISPEGRATNLGELVLEHGKGKLKVMEKLQTFGLVVTAEPYFAVSQPSNVVVMENAIQKGSKQKFEFIDARYELLKRGQYTLNMEAVAPLPRDDKTPFEVYQARNAVRIARASGASGYAPEAFGKATSFLAEAEITTGPHKARRVSAREAVQRAEDARLIAVQRQQVELVALERKLNQESLDEANRRASDAAAAKNTAVAQIEVAAAENDALRSRNDALWSKNKGLESKNDALQSNNEGLRSSLMIELNAVLQTRATARGLIVNMSGVLFRNGQATLVPAAREKLSKIAGILSTHKGLQIQAEGYTDSNGSEGYNQTLSEKRAGNARDYLVQQGVPASSISFKGFGEGNPIATNDTEAGRQENRRVELVVSGEGLTAVTTGQL